MEELALRNGSGARERERARDDDQRCADRQPARPSRQPREQYKRDREDDDAAAELAAAGEERRRPARAEQEREERRHRATCRDRERDGKHEGKDRDEDDLVHVWVLSRVDRQAEVVEVEKAAAEAVPDVADVERRHRERDAERGERAACRRDGARPPGTYERGGDCEHREHEGPSAARARLLEAQPVGRDHEGRDPGEDDRPSHEPPRPSVRR
jgi:hypothetical protein